MALIPLAIATCDNTAGTCDTINFTMDGACLINGGATGVVQSGTLSRTISAAISVTPYGVMGVNAPYPILYPPQTFYVGGKAITV